jgi:hypothetical protein
VPWHFVDGSSVPIGATREEIGQQCSIDFLENVIAVFGTVLEKDEFPDWRF